MGMIRKYMSVGTAGLIDFRSDKERTARYAKQTRNEVRKLTSRGNGAGIDPDTEPNAKKKRSPLYWAGFAVFVVVVGIIGLIQAHNQAASPSSTTVTSSVPTAYQTECTYLLHNLNGSSADYSRYSTAMSYLQTLQGTSAFTPQINNLWNAVVTATQTMEPVGYDTPGYPSENEYLTLKDGVQQACLGA